MVAAGHGGARGVYRCRCSWSPPCSAAGTLRGLSWFQQGATERAAYALAATWALVLLTFCGWLLPRAEPYRTSRIIGEKLATFSAKLGIEPVLLEYQEPGVIYAAGRPIPLTRDRDSFFAHLGDGRSVLTVALQSEIDVMRSYFGLIVTPVDEVDGYVLTKAKHQTLKIAIVRQGELHRSLRNSPRRRAGLGSSSSTSSAH